MFSIFRKKIFCISFQRTGTTSTGQFFKDHGFKVANWAVSRKNDWTVSWFKGDFEKIFRSSDFSRYQVFEDDPWWLMEFYKVLYHRFPKSKFIILERDPDRWFNSMMSHSNGKTLGNTHRHSVIYNREDDFYSLGKEVKNLYSREIDNLLPIEEKHREHYKRIYQNRNREVKLFFEIHNPQRLFTGRLEDKEIWQKVGDFFSIPVESDYQSHANASQKS